MREHMTTLLDTLGVLAVATGAGVAVGADVRAGAGIFVAGLVLLGAVRLAERLSGSNVGPSLDAQVKSLWDRAGELSIVQRDRLRELLRLGAGDRA